MNKEKWLQLYFADGCENLYYLINALHTGVLDNVRRKWEKGGEDNVYNSAAEEISVLCKQVLNETE